jgi:hypothetical protein
MTFSSPKVEKDLLMHLIAVSLSYYDTYEPGVKEILQAVGEYA